MTKVKASALKGKSLYDIVAAKGKKVVDAMRAPFIKSKLKGDFTTQVNAIARHIIDLKGKEIDLLLNVTSINVGAILALHTEKKVAYEQMLGMAAIYMNIFGEELDLPISAEDLAVVANDVLSEAIEVEDDD